MQCLSSSESAEYTESTNKTVDVHVVELQKEWVDWNSKQGKELENLLG